MGEPAIPPAKERAEVRELAAAIVDSVRADEEMPLPFRVTKGGSCAVGDVHDLAFRLAQEIELQRDAVAEAMLRCFYLYNGYSVGSRHVSGCLLDALDAVAPGVAAEIRDGVDMHDLYAKHFGDRE